MIQLKADHGVSLYEEVYILRTHGMVTEPRKLGVTTKQYLAPSGDKHDFMSFAV